MVGVSSRGATGCVVSGDPITPAVRRRTCKSCEILYVEPFPWHKLWPRGFCAAECHAAKVRREAPAPTPRVRIVTRKPAAPVRRSFTPASSEQRAAVHSRRCLVDGSHEGKTQPAHLIPRSMLEEGQEDARATVPLCPVCHRLYDSGELSLLEYLEPRFRVEIAFAVERFGLISTLRRVTNDRYAP